MRSVNFGTDQWTGSCDVAWTRRLVSAQTACTTPSVPRKRRADSAGRTTPRATLHCAPVVQATRPPGSTASHAEAGRMAGVAGGGFATRGREGTPLKYRYL